MRGNTDIMKDIAISRDSRLIASAGNRDGRVIVWSPDTGKVLLIFGSKQICPWVRATTFSPDGTKILSGCGNKIMVWDLATGKLLNQNMRHGAEV